MKLMGKHAAPLDGVTLANGHALAPFTVPAPLQVTSRGPVDTWPQVTRPGHLKRWRESVTSHRGWLAAVPVVLVNAVAFGAQLSFWRAHLGLVLEAVAVALATESIANYQAWQAHLAQHADDAALRLRLAAYGTALVIGALNYSHYMLRDWRPTVAAVTFGMMSAISPWLWSVHSRRVSRDALKSRGLIEPHAVRLGMNRWLWHPVRSTRVMFRATWEGETDPGRAIALIDPEVTDAEPAHVTQDDTPEADPKVIPEPAVQVIPEVTPEGDAEPAADVTPSRPEAVPAPRRQVTPRRKVQARSGRISDADLKSLIRAEFDADPDVTVSAAAKKLTRSRDRIRPLLEQVRAEARPS